MNKEEAPQDLIHVRLDNPVSARKDVLKSAIDALKTIKAIEESKRIRLRKEAGIKELKKTTDELRNLTKDLSSILPHPKFEEEKETKEVKPKLPKQRQPEKPKEKIKPRIIKLVRSPLDIELENIETKLRELKI